LQLICEEDCSDGLAYQATARRARCREGPSLIARTEAIEWLRFLKQIDRETPAALDLHLIADNYATHKHPKPK